jgi:hypothetical protein
VLFLEDVFKVFLKYRMNFNTIDRWKRSLLISIMKHRPIPDLIRALIVEGKSDVNIKDIYGSTPLHFAAYNNYPEQIEILLEYGADINITDNLQDRPLDTVRRHVLISDTTLSTSLEFSAILLKYLVIRYFMKSSKFFGSRNSL